MTARNDVRIAADEGHEYQGRARPPKAAVAAAVFAFSLGLALAVFQTFDRHPWSMLDLRVYVWGGALAGHSQDPYLYTYPPALHFTYTPLAAASFAPLAWLSLPVAIGIITAVSVGSLIAVIWLTWGAVSNWRSRDRIGATLAVAAVALWIEPVRQTLSFGQVNLILMLVIVADLCMPDSRRWKGVGVGLAAGFKLTPLIFIPYLLITRRFRAAAVATATFALTIAASAAVLPKATEHYWFDRLFLNPTRVGNVRFIGNQSLYGAILRLVGSAAAARPYQLAAAAVIGTAGLLLAAWASRRGQEMIGILVCALTGLLVSPVSWSHHWVWVAPLLVVLADLATRPRSLAAPRFRRWAPWLGAAAVAVLFSGVLWIVPASPARGYTMTGFQQVIGDLYVLAGLAGLVVMAGILAYTRPTEKRPSGMNPPAASEAHLAQPS
jgi:alpha-1,2-mannosyltransferase